VPKKFSWEVDKTSLILRVTDGAKETTWKLRKNIGLEEVSQVTEDIWVALQDTQTLGELANKLMPSVEERVDAWESQSSTAVQADTEEASRAAQAARVAQLNVGAKWWPEDEDEEAAFVAALPDYDAGEI
jgi:hypothetical protein